MLLLRLPRSARADNTENYPEMWLERNGKPEGTSDDSQGDPVRIIPKSMSDMGVGEFGVSPLSVMYAHKILSADPSLFR